MLATPTPNWAQCAALTSGTRVSRCSLHLLAGVRAVAPASLRGASGVPASDRSDVSHPCSRRPRNGQKVNHAQLVV